jgi:dihydropteroate synthase
MRVAHDVGVQKIWIDPGMGAFLSGDPEVSFELIERISELDVLGVPVVVGASRKGFLGDDRLGSKYKGCNNTWCYMDMEFLLCCN